MVLGSGAKSWFRAVPGLEQESILLIYCNIVYSLLTAQLKVNKSGQIQFHRLMRINMANQIINLSG